MPRLHYLPRILLLGSLALLGLGGGLAVGRWTAAAPSAPAASSGTAAPATGRLETSFYPGPPQTLAALVESADLIVVGQVGDLVQEGRFAGYDARGRLVTAQAKGLPPQANVPYYDYAIHVEESFKGTGLHRGQEPVILRTSVRADEPVIGEHVDYPPSIPGQRYLFFLTQNPDRTTYRLHHAWGSRLLIDGPIVTFSDGTRTPIAFDGQVRPAAFMAQLKTTIAAHMGQQ